jgi:thiol-disulfide isomerase/thioredoxin
MFFAGVKNWKWIVPCIAVLFVCACAGNVQPVGTKSGILLGEKTWEAWKAEAGWKSYSADYFQPPEAKIEEISRLVKQKAATFLIFGGSWCSDTEAQLPRIEKILNLASVPIGEVHLFGVDRRMREPSGTAEKWNISKVPTVIILSQGKEIGRIVEYPEASWEDDILKILSR